MRAQYLDQGDSVKIIVNYKDTFEKSVTLSFRRDKDEYGSVTGILHARITEQGIKDLVNMINEIGFDHSVAE